jgi:hypothetical protein
MQTTAMTIEKDTRNFMADSYELQRSRWYSVAELATDHSVNGATEKT